MELVKPQLEKMWFVESKSVVLDGTEEEVVCGL